MRIAITGGSGRIGRAVVAMALAQGHGVVNIDRAPPPEDASHSEVPFIQTDIGDYGAFERAMRGCDALIHLAAIPTPGRHPDHVVHNNNVVGSYNALRAAAELGIQRVCQASSINATGAAYSRWPRYDYFPLDEQHPTYNEDPYSLSKWICEQQGDSFARRYEGMTIASMRFHWVVPDRETATKYAAHIGDTLAKHLWAYTLLDAAARACLLSLTPQFSGHEPFYIVAPDTMVDTPSLELAQQFFPEVPIRGDMSGRNSFFNSAKAERLLGWKHDEQAGVRIQESGDRSQF
jgi:UDP-glucose 4-epimerase